MRRLLPVLLVAALTAPTALAAEEDDAVEGFLSTLALLEGEYREHQPEGADSPDFKADVTDTVLPALHERWTNARPIIAVEHAHEAEAIDEALEALDPKVRAAAPIEEVARIIETIEHEIAEATGATKPTKDLETALAQFRAKLDEVLAAYEAGDSATAIAQVREAYLDVYGPELEAAIVAVDDTLNAKIEELLNVKLVNAINVGAPIADVRAIVAQIDHELDEAEQMASAGRSAGATLFNSFLIIVREGFEAMLVIGALATYLIRTGHKAKAPMLYWGAAAGIAASVALWFVMQALVDALPIDREVLEGVTALLAVVVLFYVSYWLISKVEVGRWNRFVQGKMKGALAKGSSFALVGIAFLAVFREGFETALFYQGLYAGAGGQTHGVAVTSGLVVGAIVLAAAALAFYRFGVKLPLRPFFIATSVLLYYLAFAFTGAGVHELQEAGLVPTTLVPAIDDALQLPVLSTMGELLSLHATVETLVAQGFLLAAVALGLAWTLVLEPRREKADEANSA